MTVITTETLIKTIKKALVKDPNDLSLWSYLRTTVRASKAVWSSAYINDLPDAAFALIQSGGELDEGGMTTPRSLRKLPHHISTVTDGADNDTADWPHVINGLARVDQVEGASDEEKALAKEHLQKHFDEIKAETGDEEEILI
jgi:hypothetical protein